MWQLQQIRRQLKLDIKRNLDINSAYVWDALDFVQQKVTSLEI